MENSSPQNSFHYDLHIHSSWSDGKNDLYKIFEQVINKKIKGFAICDHNGISPQLNWLLSQVKKNSIEIIEGIEISTQFLINKKSKLSLHILGYSFNFSKDLLRENLKVIVEGYQKRGEKILKKCQKSGLPLDYEGIKGSNQSSYLSRNTIAEAISKSLGINFEEALKIAFIKDNENWFLDPFQAISLIKRSGGIPILAHPGKVIDTLLQKTSKSIFERLIDYGLKGIEIFHPSHGESTINILSNLAKEYGLLITGGTDYHGPDRPPFTEIGDLGIMDKYFLKLKETLEETSNNFVVEK